MTRPSRGELILRALRWLVLRETDRAMRGGNDGHGRAILRDIDSELKVARQERGEADDGEES